MPKKASRWDQLVIRAGEAESESIGLDPGEHLVVPGGRVQGQKGRLRGRDRPKFSVHDEGDQARIVLDDPAKEDLTFDYKIGEDDEDEAAAGG